MLGALLYVALLAVLTVLAIRSPHAALVAILCMFGLEQLGQIYIPYLRENASFTNLYVLLLTAVAVIIAYFSGRIRLWFKYHDCRVRIFSFALYSYALLSLAWSPTDGWIYWSNAWPYFVLSVILAPMLLNTTDDLQTVQRAFIWSGGVLIVFMAFVPDWGARSLIISGTDEDLGVPLSLAQLSGYMLITGVAYLKKSYRSVLWLILVVISALLVALKTGSRGQFIFSILSVVLIFPLLWKRFTLKNAVQLAATLALIMSISYFAFDTTVTHSSRWEADRMADDLFVRFGLVKELLSEWIGSPSAIIFGLGNSASFSDDLLGRYPHVVPLEILGEEGLVGFVLFAAIVTLSIRQALKIHSLTILSKDIKRAYAASFGCFLFTLFLSLKQGSLLNSPMIFFFAVISEKYFYLVKYELYRNTENLYRSHVRAVEVSRV